MTKQIFLALLFLLSSVFSMRAQSMSGMIVEKTDGPLGPILECNTPSLGVLVFSSTIQGLEFKLNLPSKLINQAYRQKENWYILCVEPTDRRYIVTITCPSCEAVFYTVEEIPPTIPLYFRIISDAPGEEDNNAGEKYLSEGKLKEAEEGFRKAVEAARENPKFHHSLANTLMLQKKYDEAVRSFQKAIDLAPNNTQYRIDLERADVARKSARRELIPQKSPTGINKYGFMDKNTGDIVIACSYDRVWGFSEQIDGLAKVYNNIATQSNPRAILKYGFIDKTGKEVIPLKYDDIYTFSDQIEEFALVRLGGYYGFIDKFGKEQIPVKYSNRDFKFSEGLAVVMVDKFYGFIDRTGREIIPPKFTFAENFSRGLAEVVVGKDRGFIDVAGNFYKGQTRDKADKEVAKRRANGEYKAVLAKIEQANEAEKQRVAVAKVKEREAEQDRERVKSENRN